MPKNNRISDVNTMNSVIVLKSRDFDTHDIARMLDMSESTVNRMLRIHDNVNNGVPLSEYDAVHEAHVRNAEVLTGKTAIFQIKEEEPLPPKEGDGTSDAERLMAIEYIQSRIKQGEKALAALRVIERMICDGED